MIKKRKHVDEHSIGEYFQFF